MYEKFGKSFRDIAALKTSFFLENEKHLRRSQHFANVYTKQPARLFCKICEDRLPVNPSFVKHTIPYAFCTSCGQLNGMHEDTDAFCEAVYTSDGGKEYAENYSTHEVEAYNRRRDAIYVPKAEFLRDVLRSDGVEPERLKYADMGAGAGYFISALMATGAADVTGFEVGEAQVKLGKWIDPSLPLNVIGLHDAERLVRETSAEVISFIGVFEHLQNPRAILAAIKSNPAIRYFYFCVPMFSPTIFTEMVFPEVMPRQLTVGHTHLFTRSSLAYIENEFGFIRAGAWWFGTDMMDYYRSVSVTLAGKPEFKGMVSSWSAQFEQVLDEMQLVIDRHRDSSQVHVVLKVQR
jgi:hypothetical protein